MRCCFRNPLKKISNKVATSNCQSTPTARTSSTSWMSRTTNGPTCFSKSFKLEIPRISTRLSRISNTRLFRIWSKSRRKDKLSKTIFPPPRKSKIQLNNNLEFSKSRLCESRLATNSWLRKSRKTTSKPPRKSKAKSSQTSTVSSH